MMQTNPIAIPSTRSAPASATRNTGTATDPFAQMLERQRASNAAASNERAPNADRPKATASARPVETGNSSAPSAPAASTDAASATAALPDAVTTETEASALPPATPSDAALAQAGAAAVLPAVNPLVSQIQELTERSRLLADTVVALKTHPTELPTDPATLTQWLNGELPLTETAVTTAATETTLLAGAAVPVAATTTAVQAANVGPETVAQETPALVLPAAAANANSGWQAPIGRAPGAALPATDTAAAALAGLAPQAQESLVSQPAPVADLPATANTVAVAAAPEAGVWAPPLQAAGQSAAPAALPPAIQAQVAVPLQSPQWGAAFGQQIVRLGTDGQQGLRHVELRLDPPDLGPVRISLSLAGEQASAWFISPHAAVRQAIEQALPQLQQALADAGIQLGHTSVGEQHQPGSAPEGTTGREAPDEATLLASGDGNDALPSTPRAAPRGLVDTFA